MLPTGRCPSLFHFTAPLSCYLCLEHCVSTRRLVKRSYSLALWHLRHKQWLLPALHLLATRVWHKNSDSFPFIALLLKPPVPKTRDTSDWYWKQSGHEKVLLTECISTCCVCLSFLYRNHFLVLHNLRCSFRSVASPRAPISVQRELV